MKYFLLLIAAVAVASVSCERHEFDGPDGTKQLHEHGADHGAAKGEHAEPAAAH
jgi:hypothetical protein